MLTSKFVISPPFGNWIAAPDCTRILGSFTWEPRPGLLYHTMRSLRRIEGGWVNQIGLRNRGIRQVKFLSKHIYSLVGLETDDWERMLDFCPAATRIEVNLGCPNVHAYGIGQETLRAYCDKFQVIAKLPPTASAEMVAMCVAAGVDAMHLCNTLPSPRGGISGQLLHSHVGKLIREVATQYPHVSIIAGGGIYHPADIERYAEAGAHHFSLATIWLSPWRVPAVLFQS